MSEQKHATEPKKGLRLQCRAMMITYPGHFSKDALMTIIKTKISCEIKMIRCAHETGESGYKHTHCLVWMKKLWDHKNAERLFDIGETHPNIKKIDLRGKHLENSIRYLGKEDPENKDLIEWTQPKKNVVQEIQSCTSRDEAINKFCTTENGRLIGSNVNVVERLFNERNKEEYEPEITELFNWQKWLIKKSKTRNNREIIWIYDPVGGGGKTMFGKYIQHKKMGVYLSGSGNGQNHVAQYAAKMKSIGENLEWWIINMTRAQENNETIYGVLESLKDGIMTSTKYEGTNLLMRSPCVTVMANSLPKKSRLSADRWTIVRISNDKGKKCFEIAKGKEWINLEDHQRRQSPSEETSESGKQSELHQS